MTDNNSLIQKLEERQEKLRKQIKDAKAKAARKAAALYERKCRIVGAALLAEMDNNPALAEQLRPLIDARTTKPSERKMMGLSVPNKAKDVDKAAQAR